MLENEVDMFKHQLEHRLEDQGLDMATYLKSRQIDESGLFDELKPSAEARLKKTLVLFEVAKVETIQVDENQVQAEAIRTLNEISQSYSQKDAKKMVNEQFIQNMIGNITSDLLIKNSLKRLETYAKGEEVKVDAEVEAASEESPIEETGEGDATENADTAVSDAETQA